MGWKAKYLKEVDKDEIIITLSNAQGQEVLTSKVLKETGYNVKIDLSEMPKGIYYIKAREIETVKKLVKY